MVHDTQFLNSILCRKVKGTFQEMVDRHILWGLIFLTFFLLFKLPRVDGPLVKGISLLLFIRYFRKIKLRFTGSLAALIAIYIWAASSIQWSIDKASTLNAIVDHFWCLFLALMLAMACRSVCLRLRHAVFLLYPHLLVKLHGLSKMADPELLPKITVLKRWQKPQAMYLSTMTAMPLSTVLMLYLTLQLLKL